MCKSRRISVPLAGTLSAVALAGPAAASQHASPPTWPANPKPITTYAAQLPGPPTWPTHPTPIPACAAPSLHCGFAYHGSVEATGDDFDWASAGIGAGASLAALAAGAAGAAGVRRRRIRAHTVPTS
jgi:hypothetical protein